MPIHFANRKFGQSKLSLKEQLNYLKHLKRLADYKYGWFSRLFQFCLVGGRGPWWTWAATRLLLDLAVPHPLAAVAAVFGAGSFLGSHRGDVALAMAGAWPSGSP